MAAKSIGSALEIPQSALDSIRDAEKKLQALQDKAKDVATNVVASFSNMANGVTPFETKLDNLIQKLNLVASAAGNANTATSGFGQQNVSGIQNFNNAIQQAIANINKMASSLQTGGSTGASGVMIARQAVQDLVNAMKNASGMNIAHLKEEIDSINKILKDTSYNLTKTDQDALNQRKKMLQDELKEQERTVNERAANYAKAIDKMLAAEERLQNKQKKAYKANAQDYQKQNYTQNTTYGGALSFSGSANTLSRQQKAIEYLTAAKMKLSTADADYKQKLDTLNAAIERHKKVLREAGDQSRQLAEQQSYLSRNASQLAQRMAVLFTMNTAKDFMDKIVEVRGQFEMSQRSLESILQNKPEADQIFQKTVELAIKSPFQIKDLVQYTRQMAAYRIENDKLYDTTKRLADISAGLGVDMQRLILAYGQVKAAAYLRGSEVRQFTEAGVNMYGELQAYFKEVKGEAYTTAQIVDMISKKQVTFEDVEQVFRRLTSEGGLFYNMQEIQSETLQGKIANLADSFDVMYNAIGKEHEGQLKGMISFITSMLDKWEAIGAAIQGIIVLLMQMKLWTMANGTSLSAAFNANFVAVPLKTASSFGVLRNMLVNIGHAALAMGNMIKASLAANLPLLAVMGAMKAGMDVYSAISDTLDKFNKAADETVRMSSAVTQLATAYSHLKDASNGASGNKGSEQWEKNVEDRRLQLQKLISLAEKNGLVLDIDVETIDEGKLDETFNSVLGKYKSFINELEIVRRQYAINDNWNTWLTDGLDDDAGDYKDAIVDFLANGEKIRQTATEVQSYYKQIAAQIAYIQKENPKVAKQMQAAMSVVNTKQGEKESDAEYLQRVYHAMKDINSITFNASWGKTIRQNMADIESDWSKMNHAAEELDSELDAVFGNLDEKTKRDPIKMKALIDMVAAEHDWNQYERELAYRKFGIKIAIDESEASNQTKWLDKYLQDFFNKKKYKVNLVVKEITDDNAMGDFISKGDEAAKAAKNWAEVEKRLKGISKYTKSIDLENTNYDDIKKLFNSNGVSKLNGKVLVSDLISLASQYKKAATETSIEALGVDPFEKANKDRAKKERDIINERIQLYKDMANKYKELQEVMGKKEALSSTRDYFTLAAKNAGVDISSFVPTKKAVAEKIKELAAQYKELTKKSNALRTAADIEVDINKERVKKQLENVKTELQSMLDEKELHMKLADIGLKEHEIQQMFGRMEWSYDDIRKATEKAYADKFGKSKKSWGTDVTKQYEEEMRGLDKKQYNEQVSQMQELVKAYGAQLSDQLQLYMWYLGEREKISSNTKLTDEQKDTFTKNLDTQYNKKKDENNWKNFQGSQMYINMFENLEGASDRMLAYMSERIETLKGSLKNLDPSDLKTITEQMEKIKSIQISRNPFKGFITGLKEMIKQRKKYKEMGGDKALIAAQKDDDSAQETVQKMAEQTAAAESLYDNLLKTKGAMNDETKVAEKNYKIAKKQLETAKDIKKITEGNLKNLEDQQGWAQTSTKTFSDTMTEICNGVSDVTGALQELYSALGGSDTQMSNAINLVDHVAQAIGNYYSGNYGGMVSNIVGALGDIANLINDESGIDDAIERQKTLVDQLTYSYEKLYDAMSNAYSISILSESNDKAINNIKAQIAAYNAMIVAEQERKDPDDSQIESWQQSIRELNDSLEELAETQTELLGGFGSAENYKSAAESFAEAWVAAFMEGEDALDALNDNFDEYFDNLLAKQITQRASKAFIEPILKAVDEAVSEGSEGDDNGLELTKAEVERIQKLKEENLAAYNEYAKNMMGIMGVKSRSSSELSGLQKGIQSVTESTAEALESLLNSMRYYLATQQADVRIIRDTLLNNSFSSGTDASPSSQMVTLLQQEISYVKQIASSLTDIMTGGHAKGGRGIKVFIG